MGSEFDNIRTLRQERGQPRKHMVSIDNPDGRGHGYSRQESVKIVAFAVVSRYGRDGGHNRTKCGMKT